MRLAIFLYLPNIEFRADFSKFLPEGNEGLAFYENYSLRFGARDRNEYRLPGNQAELERRVPPEIQHRFRPVVDGTRTMIKLG